MENSDKAREQFVQELEALRRQVAEFEKLEAERKQAEEQLAILNERLALATDVSSIGVWDWDLRTNLTTWDDKMFEIYGIPKMVPMPYENWTKTVYPADLPKAEASLQKAVEYGVPDHVEFQIRSNIGEGTLITARKWVKPGIPYIPVPELDLSVFSRPFPGQRYNGDAYFVKRYEDKVMFAVIDGLGHGQDAQEAAQVAVDWLENYHRRPFPEIFQLCHQRLKKTRGTAMSLCRISLKDRIMTHAGVGNMQTRIILTNKNPMVMTTDDVAEYLRISQACVYRMVRERKIPVSRIGKYLLFRRR